MSKKSPRVLMVGIAPGESDGGGITIKNLFSAFDKNDLAAIIPDVRSGSASPTGYCSVYQLGKNERADVFPFNLIQKSADSGPLNSKKSRSALKKGKLNSFIKLVGHKILAILGLSHILKTYELSPELEAWIENFSPDVIYCQLAVVDMIRFVTKIYRKYKLPLIIHTMDDWPETINRHNLLYFYWRRKIDQEFRFLVDRAALLMGISEEMCREFRKRYHRKFVAFHNPIDLRAWLPSHKSDWKIGSPGKLVYFGVINGFSNQTAISDVALAVSRLNKKNIKINFDIFTFQSELPIAKKLGRLSGVRVHKSIAHHLIPKTISKYDLCIIPINIDKLTNKFAKLSMPTKASECMASGVPTIVYAGECTALYKNAMSNKWAYSVGQRDGQTLEDAIETMMNDQALRERTAKIAMKFSKDNFDILQVSKSFKSCIVEIVK